MQVTLYAAASLDGLIARADGKTDWVKDWEMFEQTAREFGCVVMGRNTFKEGGSVFKDVESLVLSSKPGKSRRKNVHFVNSVEQAIATAKKLGFKKLLVIGGAKTNESFAKAGVLTGLMVDIHPIRLGAGKKLFADFTGPLKLKLLSREGYPEGFTHMVYKAGK
jgi:dihydrofolate reductase